VSTTSRLDCERDFHDRQAGDRSSTFDRRPEDLSFNDNAYLDHETWIRPALDQLGWYSGLRVLDYGCGHGMAAVVMARGGARVTALDVSSGYLAEAGRRAKANGVSVDLVQADGERLPFADGSFDRVWGNAVLHHLAMIPAGRELFRVLRPGGVAVFCEPWGENPLLHWIRRHLPYSGKQLTSSEEPLRPVHVRLLAKIFPGLELRGVQFLSMMRRLLPRGSLVAFLDRTDAWLLGKWPGLQRYCRYVVLTMRR
jgi:ubiquinone/menaquinone biosynthesis C-methylase UbiE